MSDKANAEAAFRKAVERHTSGQLAEALTLYGAVIRLAPRMAAAHSNRAAILNTMGRYDLALKSCDHALELSPDFADAWNNRGNALESLARAEEAVASYNRALSLKPNYPAAFNNRGNALRKLGRLEQALESYDKATALAPDYAEAYYNRGIIFKDMKRLDEAIADYTTAIALRPEYAEAFNNRGNALQELERLEDSLESFDSALALRPGYAEAWNNRGVTLRFLKRHAEALASFERALALVPNFADAQWNKSLCLLQLGKFEEGWQLYDWRTRRADPNIPSALPGVLWTGEEDISGKTLLIQWEQGLGDTIQFCRYAKFAEDACAKVVLTVQDRLAPLIQSLSPAMRVIDASSPLPPFDFYAPLLSLPRIFHTNLSTASIPYLHADPGKVCEWREKLGSRGFKIGICWQGEKSGGIDLGRSFPLRVFARLAEVPGVRLISLQRNAGMEQLAGLPPGMNVETPGNDFDAGPSAFLDSAAMIESLDLVISSDTAIAHLAGALGRPVWVALKHVSDWRWLLDRDDSLWYPSMRLFRQTSRGDWQSVFSEMESALKNLVNQPALAAARVPVSWGEMIDKITILEIKSARIAGEAAQTNIRKELSALQELAAPILQGNPMLLDAVSQLRKINEELWELENDVRAREISANFDSGFVAAARAIYARNDERSRVKREINRMLGSEFVEEKSYLANGPL